MTPNQISTLLSDYARTNLSPRQAEREMITRRYERLKESLSGRTFQNGSYARHTSTTPVHDLDVFYVLPDSVRRTLAEKKVDPKDLTIENILVDLAQELECEYGNEAQIKVQPHSVGLFFDGEKGFSIDVVPAQPTNGELFLVPETALKSIRERRLLYKRMIEDKSLSSSRLQWIKSDPKGYIAQAIELDEVTNGTFRKSVKVIKKWRQGCKQNNDIFPLKSFHLEIVLTELFMQNPSLSCYESIRQFFSILPSVILAPSYRDRADETRFIDAYICELTEQQRILLSNEQYIASQLIEGVAEVDSRAELLRIVNELLRIRAASTTGIVSFGEPRIVTPISKPYLEDRF